MTKNPDKKNQYDLEDIIKLIMDRRREERLRIILAIVTPETYGSFYGKIHFGPIRDLISKELERYDKILETLKSQKEDSDFLF